MTKAKKNTEYQLHSLIFRRQILVQGTTLDILQLCLIDSEIEAYPKPSSIENIRLGKNEKAVLIQYDTDKIDISKFKFFNE